MRSTDGGLGMLVPSARQLQLSVAGSTIANSRIAEIQPGMASAIGNRQSAIGNLKRRSRSSRARRAFFSGDQKIDATPA
jgi:hypothetical protein